jgi:SAM-dependent methyltransferase
MTHYDVIGDVYGSQRRTDPRIAAVLWDALGGAKAVLNVGAGTGSYEPPDAQVIALDRSHSMLQHHEGLTTPLIQGSAEALPLNNGSVDAVMAVLTIHHWVDQKRGVDECVRVARERVVILTWDPDSDAFWLARDYFPELLALDRRIFPPLNVLTSWLNKTDVRSVPIPADCVDGFLGAYWQRPASYLDPGVRAGMSSFSRISDASVGLTRLANDLESGAWQRRYDHLSNYAALDIGYRLVVGLV